MSPKSKTQKRNQQKKQQRVRTVGSNVGTVSNNQQLQIHELAKQLDVLKKKEVTFDAAQKFFRDTMRATKGSPSYDPNFVMPSSNPAVDIKIDEKYVKVPDVCESAVDQLMNLVENTKFLQPENVNSKDQKTVATTRKDMLEQLKTVKELIGKPLIDSTMQRFKDVMSRKFGSRAGGMSSIRHSRQKPLKVLIGLQYDWVSSAATAYTTVQQMTPIGAADAVSLGAVYDICRTTAVDLETHWWCQATSTGDLTANTKPCTGAYAYDPANNGTYSSIIQVLEAPYAVGPIQMSNLSGQAGIVETKGHKKRIKIPRLVDPGLVTDLLDSNWVSSVDTSVLVGYLKPFIEAAGSNQSTHTRIFAMYEMEFAYRT